MNLFKDISFRWWQVSLLKISVFFFGIAAGAYWPAVFMPYLGLLLAVAVILALYLGYVWLIQR